MAATKMIGNDRPQRTCIACGQTDDHPRHSVQIDPERWADFHLDCHARMDPPCRECASRVEGADGKTGAQLLAHLLSTTTTKG